MNQWRSAYYAGRGSKKNGTQSRVWARQFGAVLAMDEPLSAYAGLAVPVLLIAGTTGPLPARRVTELLGRAFGNAKLRVIPGAGHMAPITQPNKVNPYIIAHLASHPIS